ncbi:MAG: IS200/IS605 family transposase [Spirochaetota bacterium]
MEYQQGVHSVYDTKYHLIWSAKYRYYVLKGEAETRTRELIRQTCLSRDVTIVQGSIGKDDVHMLVSCPHGMDRNGHPVAGWLFYRRNCTHTNPLYKYTKPRGVRP